MRLVRVAGAALILTAGLAAPALAGVPESDIAITKSDTPDPVAPGGNVTYTITVLNQGPQDGINVVLNDAIPAGTTFVQFTAPAGWTSTTPPVGGTGTVMSSIGTLGLAVSSVFSLTVNVNLATPGGTLITNTATVTSSTFDDDVSNNSATTTTTVSGSVPPPTPAASLANAAMPAPTGGSPLVILGFAVLVVATLGATAILATRRVRL